jgi:general secretion pathway protein N
MAIAKRLIAVGAAALVAGLVVTFPARIAYQWFAPPGLVLSGISGSIWNGKAAQGSAAGLFLSDVSWRFRPLSLFGLNLGYAIAAKVPSGFVESDVAVGTGGRLHFSDLAAALPVSSLSSVLPESGIDADLNLQIDSLVLENGFPVHAEGTVGLSGLILRSLSPTALGNYRAVLETEGERITGTFDDVSGVLDLAGTVVLGRDRAFLFTGKVAATADAPATVAEQLRFLGSPDPEGRREFRFEGTL